MSINYESPNLFTYATKELSQDAFICWLGEWANPKNEQTNKFMFEVGTEFIKRLLLQHDISNVSIESIKVHRQKYGVIDVLFEIKTNIGNYAILIEDKINAGDYNSLIDYLNKVKNDSNYSNHTISGVFMKTGDQANYKKVRSTGFSIFLRNDFIDFFEKTMSFNGKNDILHDFKSNLYGYEKRVSSYKSSQIKDWDWNSWTGFYEFLHGHIDMTWEYVPNASGGFLGAWWSFHKWNNFSVYLQLEQDKFCFKIGDVPMEDCNPSEIRNEWYTIIINEATRQGYNEIKKPERFGYGSSMTVAIVEKADWLGKENETVDVEKVLKNLSKYEEFLSNCTKEISLIR
jgi:hypothetical protein